MRQFVFFALIFGTMISCGKEDDLSMEGTSAITGKWKVDSYLVFVNGSDGSQVIKPDDCEAQTVSDFGANGTLSVDEFFNKDGECKEEKYTRTYIFNSKHKTLTIAGKIYPLEKFDDKTLEIITDPSYKNENGGVEKHVTVLTKLNSSSASK